MMLKSFDRLELKRKIGYANKIVKGLASADMMYEDTDGNYLVKELVREHSDILWRDTQGVYPRTRYCPTSQAELYNTIVRPLFKLKYNDAD